MRPPSQRAQTNLYFKHPQNYRPYDHRTGLLPSIGLRHISDPFSSLITYYWKIFVLSHFAISDTQLPLHFFPTAFCTNKKRVIKLGRKPRGYKLRLNVVFFGPGQQRKDRSVHVIDLDSNVKGFDLALNHGFYVKMRCKVVVLLKLQFSGCRVYVLDLFISNHAFQV